jgi:proline iminopeptidase
MDFSRLQTTSKVTDADWLYPLKPANRSGWVDVTDGHSLYWEEYGRADGEPVMVLHGGPGGACEPALSRFFDPDRYRVILFDQRGCGKSRPSVAEAGPDAGLAANTTDHLCEDIERLRDALGIAGKMHVFGGSWGSTLALVYGIRHSEHVESLILRGIFLGRRRDLFYMYQGNAATYAQAPFGITEPGSYITYPDEWRAFVEVIPPAERSDMMAAYKRIFDLRPTSDAERRRQAEAAQAWSVWEGVTCNLIPQTADVGKFAEADFSVCFAQIEAHFFANDLFLPPDYILKNIGKAAGIPMHIVHGRYDQLCPLTQACELVEALRGAGAEPATLVIPACGHSSVERETYLALTAIMDGLPRMGAQAAASASA